MSFQSTLYSLSTPLSVFPSVFLSVIVVKTILLGSLSEGSTLRGKAGNGCQQQFHEVDTLPGQQQVCQEDAAFCRYQTSVLDVANSADGAAYPGGPCSSSHRSTASDISHDNSTSDFSHDNTPSDISHRNSPCDSSTCNATSDASPDNTPCDSSHNTTAGDISQDNTLSNISHDNRSSMSPCSNSCGDSQGGNICSDTQSDNNTNSTLHDRQHTNTPCGNVSSGSSHGTSLGEKVYSNSPCDRQNGRSSPQGNDSGRDGKITLAGIQAMQTKGTPAVASENSSISGSTKTQNQEKQCPGVVLTHRHLETKVTPSQPSTAGKTTSSQPSAAGKTTNSRPQVASNTVHYFSGHCTRNQKRQFRAYAQMKALQGLKRMAAWDDSHPTHAYWAPKRVCRAAPEPHPSCSMPKEKFAQTCGLVSCTAASQLRQENEQGGEVDLDCQIVGVEGPLFGGMPHSPRTTRSLMSQLSREHAQAGKKRLSFGQDSEDGSDSETLDAAATRRCIQVSLLAIDCCSPLGQRLKKHVKGDVVVPPISDIEQHCTTVPVLDEMAAKLRHRANEYPIMHRKRKGIVTGYCHTYKFSRSERREFMHTLHTGLNARSRRLLKQTRKFDVRLTRLRKEEIRYWTIKRRTIVKEEIAIDDDISIMQVDVPEHLFKAVQRHSVPSYSPGLRQQLLAEPRYQVPKQEVLSMSQQGGRSAGRPPAAGALLAASLAHNRYASSSYSTPTHTSGPRPQFLVKQVSKNWTENGQESHKLVFVPLEEASPSQRPNLSVRNLPAGSAQPPHTSTSSRVKKLPRHLRPCPKSRRKQRLREREESEEGFVIETESSSEGEESQVRRGPQHGGEAVYPLCVTTARDSRAGLTPWMVADKPVPQMLHVANSTSASVPVAPGLVAFLGDMVPVTPLEMQAERAGLGQAHSSRAPGSSAAESLFQHMAATREQCGVGVDPGHNPVTGEDSDERDVLQGQAATTTPKLLAALQQPNFLQLDPPKLYDSRQHDISDPPKLYDSRHHELRHPPKLYNSHQQDLGHLDQHQQDSKQQKSAQHGLPPLVYNAPSRHAAPSGVCSPSPQCEGRSRGAHVPSILRGPVTLHSPPGTGPAKQPTTAKLSSATCLVTQPTTAKLSSAKQSSSSKLSSVWTKASSSRPPSSKDWTVVRACDDDVVEVICIDDDD